MAKQHKTIYAKVKNGSRVWTNGLDVHQPIHADECQPKNSGSGKAKAGLRIPNAAVKIRGDELGEAKAKPTGHSIDDPDGFFDHGI